MNPRLLLTALLLTGCGPVGFEPKPVRRGEPVPVIDSQKGKRARRRERGRLRELKRKKKLALKLVVPGELFEIPSAVAVCPECGAPLIVQVNEWEGDRVVEVDYDCSHTPDPESPEYELWEDGHRQFGFMSLYYPVKLAVTAYVKKHYRVSKAVPA